jgi:hypothetical protein
MNSESLKNSISFKIPRVKGKLKYNITEPVAKAILTGKCLAMNTYIKNLTDNLMMHLRLLEKQEKENTKISRWKEIIKIRGKNL